MRRKNRSSRLKDGQHLYNIFFKDPEHMQWLNRDQALDLAVYAGYSVPGQTVDHWEKSGKVDTKFFMGYNHYQGRDIYDQCNSHKRKQIEKNINTSDATITVALSPDVKRFYVSMAQREDVTVSSLLSQYLNDLGSEKLMEIEEKIKEDVEILKEKHIGEMSL